MWERLSLNLSLAIMLTLIPPGGLRWLARTWEMLSLLLGPQTVLVQVQGIGTGLSIPPGGLRWLAWVWERLRRSRLGTERCCVRADLSAASERTVAASSLSSNSLSFASTGDPPSSSVSCMIRSHVCLAVDRSLPAEELNAGQLGIWADTDVTRHVVVQRLE